MHDYESRVVRSGVFEVDLRAGELRRNGIKVKLQNQPFQILAMLLERAAKSSHEKSCTPGSGRQTHLWTSTTALTLQSGGYATRWATLPENPTFVETLGRRGYRFVFPVEGHTGDNDNGNHSDPELAVFPISTSASPQLVSPPTSPVPPRWKLKAAIAIAPLAAIAVIAWAIWWNPVAPRFLRPRFPVVTGIHQLTRTGHQKSSGLGLQIVTDGSRIYFNESIKDGLRVAQISTKGGEVSYLDIPSVRNPWIADISADGSELLLFDQSTNWDNPAWLASLPNGPQRRTDDLVVAFAALVPGTNQLIYNQSSDLRQLLTADTQGGKTRPLMSAPNATMDFSVSPDGKRIRIMGGSQIWEAQTNGTGLHRFLPQLEEPMCCGHWSADGRIYAFAVTDRDGRNLWAVTESGPPNHARVSSLVQLTYGSTYYSMATFSKDGKQIYVLGNTKRGELAVYDTASGELRPYLDGISAGFVDFSRDGQWVTYVSYPQNILWRSRIDGSERLQLTFPPMGPALNPKWSPDGHLIAFTEWGDNRKISLVPATGGTPLVLLGGDSKPTDPTWSPDGKSIVYGGASVSAAAATDIRILDLDSKHSRTIPGSEHMFSPRLSPDGRYIAALSGNQTKVFLYSFETAQWKPVPLPQGNTVAWPSWSHDSRYLYVIDGSLWKFRVPDGPAELARDLSTVDITSPIVSGAWYALTPDDRILVLRDRSIDELYALDLEYR